MARRTRENSAGRGDDASCPADNAAGGNSDRSVWLVWAGVVLLGIAVLPFAVRSSEVAAAIARLCGFGGY